VGAGPVGLSIAFKLESSGLSVTLIEAEEDGAPLGEMIVSNGNHAFPDKTCRPGIGGGSAP
jgi:2-polyprenyl-6-methoxyphenol hydroxylase-like FAD-dependent oxidoreductase